MTDEVQVLPGGWMLLPAHAVRAMAALTKVAVEQQRAKGVRTSYYAQMLTHFDAALRLQASDAGSAEVPPVADLPESLVTEGIDVSEAMKIMGISDRAVRYLCTARRLEARKVGGSWLISRADVEARATDRKAS